MDRVRGTGQPRRVPETGRRTAAFSLVELVVVIGLVMILIGLSIPALAGSYSRAHLTKDMVMLRQTAAVVTQYAADFSEVYPLWGEYESPVVAAQGWPKPMLAGEYFGSLREIDPKVNEEETNFRVVMTMSAVYDWRLMRPGHTVPGSDAHWSPVRTDEVFFPSGKGLMFIESNGIDPPDQSARSFCCTDLWRFPVAMADGSVTTGNYIEFNGGQPVWEENGIGVPVWTTWLGVHGLDRK